MPGVTVGCPHGLQTATERVKTLKAMQTKTTATRRLTFVASVALVASARHSFHDLLTPPDR